MTLITIPYASLNWGLAPSLDNSHLIAARIAAKHYKGELFTGFVGLFRIWLTSGSSSDGFILLLYCKKFLIMLRENTSFLGESPELAPYFRAYPKCEQFSRLLLKIFFYIFLQLAPLGFRV